MKNVLLLVLAVVTPVTLAFGIRGQLEVAALEEQALDFQQESAWFSLDVSAVDAETGEVIARASLGTPVASGESAQNLFNPRVSRIYDAESGCTKLSGITHVPLSIPVRARGYETSEFSIAPSRFAAYESTITIELQRAPGTEDSLAALSR